LEQLELPGCADIGQKVEVRSELEPEGATFTSKLVFTHPGHPLGSGQLRETWAGALESRPLAADVCRKHVASRPCTMAGRRRRMSKPRG